MFLCSGESSLVFLLVVYELPSLARLICPLIRSVAADPHTGIDACRTARFQGLRCWASYKTAQVERIQGLLSKVCELVIVGLF
ncbi:hypothetical protein Dimus_034128 [Dionaea muscipula]